MYYTEEQAREMVLKAGLRLLETGLIARTWGNISARISKDEFIITPSGMAYDTLKAEDLVKVKVENCSYSGDIKPSSEKGIHAVSYALRPEVNFIIHTHQFFASVVGILGKDTDMAAAGSYALPGTDKLRGKMMQVIAQNSGKTAFLMQHHGALCLGKDYDDAFDIASKLEDECKAIFEKYVQSERYISDCVKIQKYLKPYIDDFAQILGTSIDITKPANEICSGEDSEAQYMILEKNCAAALFANATGAKPLNIIDAKLQRTVYLTKYSKLKK